MKNKYLSTLLKCFLFMSCVFFITACENSDLDTNQLASSEVLLRSFGPSPIARGAELRIIGTNLDKVTSVEIPGAPAISDIKRVSATEIRVTVPQTAEVGLIKLKAGDKTITSITELTFSEPIAVTKVTPLSVKPGEVIKIEGEYLNLIEEIIFVDDVHVLKADFVSQSREAIEVVVPKTAQTGKIIVSDGADIVYPEGEDPGIPIWVYSDEDLIVTLPAITQIAPQPVKPGAELTITGTNFDLVDVIRFGESDIEVSKFTVNDAKTEIKVIVPTETQFGEEKTGDVRLVAFSGVEVAKDLKLVAPAITGIAPTPAKNKGVLTIDGTHLDLVTTVVFAGDVEGTIQSQTAAKIEVEIPATAVDGNVVLNTYSGQTAEKAYTLVKPTIASVAPLSITAGDNITITGTDLDLVNEVIFKSGTATVSVKLEAAPDATSFTIKTPFTATDGTIDLKTINGTIVSSTQSLTIAVASLPIVTEMPKVIKPGALLTLKGVNLQLVSKITFVYPSENIDATQFLPDATGTTLQVYVPTTKGDVVLRLYAGTDYVESPALTIGTTDAVADDAVMIFDFDEGDWLSGALWSSIGGIGNPADALSGVYYEILPGTWNTEYWWFGNNYFTFPSVTVADHVLKMDIRLREDVPADGSEIRFRFAGNTEVNILPYLLKGNVWSTFGEWITITIPLSDVSGLSDPTATNGDWGIVKGWLETGNENFTGFCVDNIRYEPIH
jgi:hypothetical protein